MTVVETASPTADESPAAGPTQPRTARLVTYLSTGWRTDVVVAGLFLLTGLFLTVKLWVHPARMVNQSNDEILFEWMLSHAAQAVSHLHNPLFSTSLNYPTGFNLMANTSVLGLGIPLTPITLLFGPHASFLVAIVFALSATGFAWYLFLSRMVVRSRIAALVGGALCGFAPGMVAQASGHLHMVSSFLLPLIVWAVLRLRDPGRTVRRGVVLGLLVTYQVFIAEEMLVFTALGLATFLVFYCLFHRSALRESWLPFLKAGALATVVSGVLLAYPLWFQFAGPQHYRNMPFTPADYWMDITTFGSYASQTVSHWGQALSWPMAPNPSEENSFFGYGLLGLCALIVIWLWRNPTVRALGLGIVVFVALSFGPEVMYEGHFTHIPGPYRLMEHLPILDLAVPARFPMVVTPMLAILLALSIDRVWSDRSRMPGGFMQLRLIWLGVVTAVLLPLTPVPIRTYAVPPVPEFISSGQWRQYVSPGHNLIPVVPTTGAGAIWGMYWSARTDQAFNVPGGYFIGPTSSTNPQARWGAPDRWLSVLLDRVAGTGKVPDITDADRARAVADLHAYRGDVVVLGQMPNRQALLDTLRQLLGPARFVGGAWIWDVRKVAA